MLCVYALVADATSRLGRGAAREPLRLVGGGRLDAVVGALRQSPAASPQALVAYDAAQRRLAQRCAATLPARFGTTVADEAELMRLLEGHADAMAEALALVRGREQMTLRVLGAAAPRPEPAAPLADAAGPGTRYLLGRRDILALAESVPELEPLRPGLAALVRAERRERHDQPPLLASIHHLVDRGGAAAYRAAVRRGRAAVAPRQVLVRGPWPPYAFATGLGLGGTP